MHPLRCLTTLVAVSTLCAGKNSLARKHYNGSTFQGQRFLPLGFTWPSFWNDGWRTTPASHGLSRQFTNSNTQFPTSMNYPVYGSSAQYCGTSVSDPFEDRIVGGVDVIPHEFPWMGKLFHDRAFHCGAALIADRYLLTAGHCVTSHIDGSSTEPRVIRGNTINYEVKDPREFIVELGAHHLKEQRENVVRRKVERITVNPDYDVFSSSDIMLQTNDVAILKIAPVSFTANILPICLPMRDARVRDGSRLVVAGWGSTLTETLAQQTTKLPEVLQKTVLTKISHNSCRNNPFIGMHLTPNNQMNEREIFCMLGVNQDSCRGDSGGPVILKTPQGYVVAGLVSWGLGCNQKNFPAAYTQLSSYMDFVLANTRDGRFLPHKP